MTEPCATTALPSGAKAAHVPNPPKKIAMTTKPARIGARSQFGRTGTGDRGKDERTAEPRG